jgi:hypothetical protein
MLPEEICRLSFSKNIPGVTFYGEVEDAKEFINAHPITVVPLLSGSGMRVKILKECS